MEQPDGTTEPQSPGEGQECPDRALVELLRDQPTEGVPILLCRYGGILHRLASCYSRSPEDREDLNQEIVFELLEDGCRRLRNWEPGRASFSSYLFLVVRHICQNYRRKVNRIMRMASYSERTGNGPVRVVSSVPGPVEAPTQRTSVALSEALNRLNECFETLIEAGAARQEDRLLVVLRAEGHSAKTVGGLLGLEEDAVNLRYSRVRQRLVECLGRHGIKSVEDLVIDLRPVRTIYK